MDGKVDNEFQPFIRDYTHRILLWKIQLSQEHFCSNTKWWCHSSHTLLLLYWIKHTGRPGQDLCTHATTPTSVLCSWLHLVFVLGLVSSILTKLDIYQAFVFLAYFNCAVSVPLLCLQWFSIQDSRFKRLYLSRGKLLCNSYGTRGKVLHKIK